MKIWLVAGIVVAFIVLYLIQDIEGFTTVDLNTALVQRQGLQFEGERRYNPLARLQGPHTLDPDQVDDAFRQAIPTADTRTPSLLSLVNNATMGSYAQPSRGSGIDQTGAVQQKIKFCESQKTITCDQLKDPRFAECGFCHLDGVDSNGKPHRGGMFISSEDQIRANESGSAVYQPTIGKCSPKNFTLAADLCDIREKQIQCEKLGAASDGNPCGQCYGSAPPGSNGLVYVGPKPRTYTATLWVSHPGMHSSAGAGLTVRYPNGSVVSLSPSSKALLDPKQLTVDIREGDNLVITMFGAPPVWCGWLSSPDGNRVVSLNVGMQTVSSFAIAGDKNSGVVNKVLASSPLWNAWKTTVPNSVLWYMRRGNGAIVNAWYGVAPPNAGDRGSDVTAILQAIATGKSVPITNEVMRGDPAPGTYKHLWITQDTGNVIILPEGQTIQTGDIANTVQMNMIVPATLADPMFSSDKVNCPTGPLIYTEVGSGLMGSNSCFKSDGSFNPNVYCIQQLWTGAGGTPKGTKYPKTDAAAAALVGAMKLDAVVAKFNNEVNIALYGVDANGAPQDFQTVKKFALEYLGVSMSGPCDGPMAATGPHTSECLDSLWRSSGCSADGLGAPLKARSNVADANRLGSIANVRSAYQSIFNRTKDSSNFDAQAAAMRTCYGVNLQAPKDTGKCQTQYLGCFGDTWTRALPNQRADVSFTGNGQDGILACKNAAIANGDNMFSLQCSGSPSSNCNAPGRAQCFTGKDANYAKYGARQNCGPLGDAWTNQVYSIGSASTTLPNIPGIWGWYDAADPNNGSPPANGTTISLWKDKSGNKNDMSAQIAGVYQNKSIVFSKSWYRSTKPAPYPIDVYVVVKVNNPNAANDIIGLGEINVDNFNSLTLSEYTQSTWHNGSSYFQRTPNAIANQRETSTGFLLMRWSIANNNFNIYRNGVKIMETTSYTWRANSPYLNLGERFVTTSGNNLSGALSEVVVYNRPLNDNERQRVEGYLANKWGMRNSLPNGHPFLTPT